MAKNTENHEKNGDSSHGEKSEAPDGGYGWVVLMASFFVSFIIDGIMYSFTLVLKGISEDLDLSETEANWIPSLYTGFLFCSGPIVAGLANVFGCRTVVMGGAAVTSLMFLFSAYAPNALVIMISYGIVGGVSTGCAYIASLIVVAHYFDKKRGVATGITMAGSGLGSFAFALVTEYLIKRTRWEMTMSIHGACILICCILGALMKPLHSNSDKKQGKVELKRLGTNDSCPEEYADSCDNGEKRPRVQSYSGSVLSLEKKNIQQQQQQPEISIFQRNNFLRVSIGILKEMTDFKLIFQNFPFLLITLSNFFLFSGYFMAFIYMPKKIEILGLTNAGMILGINGILNIPARIIYGFLADRRILAPINLNTISIIIVTLPLYFYPYYTTSELQIFWIITFAIGTAGMNSLTTMYLVDIVGLKKFNNATGIINLFRGFGCFLGPVLGGTIVEYIAEKQAAATNTIPMPNPDHAFYFTSVCFTIGLAFTAMVSMYSCIKGLCCKNSDSNNNDYEDNEVGVALR